MAQHPIFGRLASEVHLYDSIAFIVRDEKPARGKDMHRGKSFIGYGAGHPRRQQKEAPKQIKEARLAGLHPLRAERPNIGQQQRERAEA